MLACHSTHEGLSAQSMQRKVVMDTQFRTVPWRRTCGLRLGRVVGFKYFAVTYVLCAKGLFPYDILFVGGESWCRRDCREPGMGHRDVRAFVSLTLHVRGSGGKTVAGLPG